MFILKQTTQWQDTSYLLKFAPWASACPVLGLNRNWNPDKWPLRQPYPSQTCLAVSWVFSYNTNLVHTRSKARSRHIVKQTQQHSPSCDNLIQKTTLARFRKNEGSGDLFSKHRPENGRKPGIKAKATWWRNNLRAVNVQSSPWKCFCNKICSVGMDSYSALAVHRTFQVLPNKLLKCFALSDELKLEVSFETNKGCKSIFAFHYQLRSGSKILKGGCYFLWWRWLCCSSTAAKQPWDLQEYTIFQWPRKHTCKPSLRFLNVTSITQRRSLYMRTHTGLY